jgi:cell division protein FtsB
VIFLAHKLQIPQKSMGVFLPDMDQIENLAKTYTQAPWRKQMQMVALFALGVVFAAIIAGIYLSISARATAVGRDIQSMQAEITTYNREIEDLQSQLARILSSAQMEARARGLGFEPVTPDEMVYLRVPGYTERQPAILAPSTERSVVSAVAMPPEYTESIFEWLMRNSRELYIAMVEENQ